LINSLRIRQYIEVAIAASHLRDTEEEVVRYRYGLVENQRHMTLEEIGSRMGLTRGRVRQIQLNAIRKLKFCIDDDEYTAIEEVVSFMPWFAIANDVYLAAHPRIIDDGENDYRR